MDCSRCNALGYIVNEKDVCENCKGTGTIETHITSNFVEKKCPFCFKDIIENYGGFCSQECLHNEFNGVDWE